MKTTSMQHESKTRQPLVSIIIPAYNRGRFVAQAVESALNQTYSNTEIIVVDDGSTDDTTAVLAPYLGRITLIQQPNQGVARARNTGIELSNGELVCFLDSDDEWLPEKLEHQVNFIADHPSYGLIATEIAGFNDEGKPVSRSKAGMYRIRNGFVIEHLLFANWIQTSTVMLRRECLERVGCFDETVGQFGEDWLLWMRVASEYAIYFMPQPLVRYRVHEQSLSSHLPESQYESLMRIMAKLEQLPYFIQHPHLISKARYRISLNRGRRDLRGGRPGRAIHKLRNACAERSLPIYAGGLLCMAQLRNYLDGRRANGAHA